MSKNKVQLLINTEPYIKEGLQELKRLRGGTVNKQVNNALIIYLTLIGQTPDLDKVLKKFDVAVQLGQLDIKNLWNFKA
jgi:hypothetical protein